MTRTWTGLALAISMAGVTAAAQTPGSTTPKPTTQAPSASASKSITVSGCVEPGSGATATGTTGAAGATATAGARQFILAKTTMESAAGGAAGTSGAAGGASKPAASGPSYVLDGDSAELQKHAGHKVEITGTLAPASPSGGAKPPSGAAGGAGASASASSMPHLKVASVKMVSASCP